jgi:hypothetical protein
MADTTIKDAEDTGLSDATDISNTPDDEIGDDWDDDTSSDAFEDDSELESEDDDDSAATDEEIEEDSEGEDDVDAESEEADAFEEEDSTAADDTTDSAAEQKRKNDEAAQLRIENRKARQEAERLKKQREEDSITNYLKEAADDEVELERRELNVQAYRQREKEIALNDRQLQTDIRAAANSIKLFRSGTDVQKNALADSLDDFEARYVEKDKEGRPLAIKIDPATGEPANVVKFLQRKADEIERLAGEGVKTQVKKKAGEKRRAVTTPTRAPKGKSDPDLDGFDEEASR